MPFGLTTTTIVYIFLGLVGLWVFSRIWKNLDESTKHNLAEKGKKLIIPVLLIFIYLYFRKKWGPVSESWLGEYNSATVLVFFLFMIWKLSVLFLAKERYVSTAAIADNRHGSCAKYQPIGDYMVLNIGSVDAAGFPWPYGHETWVVRREAFQKFTDQICCSTQILQADLLEVPVQVYEFISTTTGYNKNNIYYGEFSQKVKIQDPEKGRLEMEMRDTNRMLNENRTMLKGKTSAVKSFVSDTSIIQKKAKGESLLSSSEEKI